MAKEIRKFRGQTVERICRFCKQPFLIERWAVKRGSGIYCSRKCWKKHAKTGIFSKYLKDYTKNHPVWNKGLHIYLGGKRFEKGHVPWFIAQGKPNPTTTPEGRKKLSLAGIGRPHPYKGKSVTWNTGRTWFKKGHTTWNKGLPPEKQGNWRGGVSIWYDGPRKTREYRLWRKAVVERDNYTCIWCGSKENPEADHIKPFVDYPELRFAIDNGRTLCKRCHRTTETWGSKARRIK